MKLKVNSVSIVVIEPEIIVAHAVKTHECEFEFDATWDDYTKKAVFKKGNLVIKVLLKDNKCIIPWEVLETRGFLKIGIRGVCDDKRRPTVWTENILISDGPGESEPGKEPTPTLYQQMVDVMEETKAIAQSVRDDADAGKFGGSVTVEEVRDVVQEMAVTQETDPTVPNWAKQAKKPTYSYGEITGKPTLFSGDYNDLSNKPTIPSVKGLATEKYADDVSTQAVSQGVTTHNVSQDTHRDIRNLITELSNRLNAIADSDDKTLDQLSEIVAYIKANKALIESVTTSKVSVSDIVNDLETNVANKPLSASQGVALKTLINALEQSVSGLAENAVSDIGSAVAEETNELTIELKDKNGKVVATTKITLPTQEIPEVDLSGCLGKYTGSTNSYLLYGTSGTEQYMYPTISGGHSGNIQNGAIPRYQYDWVDNTRVEVVLLTGKPKYARHAANKDYVDNLPDYRTFTAEEKAKWCGMIGATKWYYHEAWSIDCWQDEDGVDVFIMFISTSPDVDSIHSVKSIILSSMIVINNRNYIIIGSADDRSYLLVVPEDNGGNFEMKQVYLDGEIRSHLVEEL